MHHRFHSFHSFLSFPFILFIHSFHSVARTNSRPPRIPLATQTKAAPAQGKRRCIATLRLKTAESVRVLVAGYRSRQFTRVNPGTH